MSNKGLMTFKKTNPKDSITLKKTGLKESITLKKIDPRVKLMIVFALTTLVLFAGDAWTFTMVTFLSVGFSWFFKVDLYYVFHKLRRFLTLVFGLIIIQSIFNSKGFAIVAIGDFKILTDVGLYLGFTYICRVIVIIMSGAIISSSSMRENLQALYQLKVPYEMGLMTSVGIRFLPILREEVRNAYIAMELRGVNVKKLKLQKRLHIISQLFVPIIYSTMTRAKKLSESIEARGFIIGEKRSSYLELKLNSRDYIVAIVGVLIVAMAAIGGGRL